MTADTPENTAPDATDATTDASTVTVLDIGGPAHGGTAVARLGADAGDHAGQVVFVRGALPGETGVPVRLDPPAGTGKRRFLTGTVTDPADITGPSAHRVAPVCPAAAAGAGCCDLDTVDAVGSAQWKREVVVDQFTRIGHVDLSDVPVTTRSPEPFTGYRTRVRLGVDAAGRAGLRKSGSHGIVPVDEAVCAQWAPALADGLATELDGLTLTPGAEVCVAVSDDGARSVVELTKEPATRRTTRGRRDHRDRRSGARHRRTRRRVLVGTGAVTHTVNGVTWTVPAESFWQAHVAAPSLYSGWIVDALGGARTDAISGDAPATAWDLYGGAGVFAAALADVLPGAEVDCVDVASAATAAGEEALSGRGVRFLAGDVAARLADLRTPDRDAGPVAVVLDPPRTGAGKQVLTDLAARHPEHVLHIGCDPATAARDAGVLCAAGYRIVGIETVDAFGLTHHVEVLVHYVRDTPAEGR